MLRFIFSFVFIFHFAQLADAQSNRIALLDLTLRNAESTEGNKFSAEHLLQVAGLPYLVTEDVNLATESNFILCTSNIETFTFTSNERDSLRSFVQNGGILFSTQLKDTLLYSLFGVSDYQYDTKRYSFFWNVDNLDPSFRWINEPFEYNIKLGDSSYTDVIGSRSYVLTTASSVAKFDDDSCALSRNSYGSGLAYNLGLSWKDLFLRNHVSNDFKASRSFSNSFEPGSDVFILFMRALYCKHNPYAVWKHTSGLNSASTVVVTHDVDATSAIQELMNSFASYEEQNHIKATYFITTHYVHDEVAKDFWHGYEDDVRRVKSKGHELASHSVSHVPDFDIESTVPEGGCGNNEFTYNPYYNGTFSTGVSVCGEVEVSKLLLERDANTNIRSFRAGYLAYNEKILNALENNNYDFNSTHSANNVMTAFPFRGHKDLSMSGDLSSVYELPNMISDVFSSDPITEENYNAKVATWVDVVMKNKANNAPNILMIHPNRIYKILALQNFIKQLSPDIRIVPFEHFGDYWKSRESCEFDYTLENDSTLLITVKNYSLPLHHDLSFIVDNGMLLDSIRVEDESQNPIPMIQSPWENQGKILHSERFSESYTGFQYVPEAEALVTSVFPNPFSTTTTFRFELMETSIVSLKIFDVSGRLIENPIQQAFELGLYEYNYENTKLRDGLYFYEFRFNEQKPVRYKMIVAGKK
ncbi:MAG: polysaccharide deacetylase family protein [Bacteroidota bacterium]|nr:polysaccharide deacetylase family protein [Bacteroidota bacterium]